MAAIARNQFSEKKLGTGLCFQPMLKFAFHCLISYDLNSYVSRQLVSQLACKIYCYTKYQVLFSLWRIKLAVKTVNCYLKLLLYHWLSENFSFVSHIINSRYKFLRIFWINRKKSIKKLPPTAVGTFLISVFDLKQLCKTMPTEKC